MSAEASTSANVIQANGVAQLSSGDELRRVQRVPIPRQAFVCIEYPGILKPADATPQAAQASLDAALRTLSPQPAKYATSAGALSHIGRCLALESSILECRLGSSSNGGRDAAETEAAKEGAAGGSSNEDTQAYRHAVLGELVDTQNLVARIRTRKWKRVRRNAMDVDDDAQQGASGTSSTSSNSNVQYVYEHTAQVVGVARKTARWRSLADFVGAPEPQVEPDEEQTPALSLVDALLRMDFGAMQEYRLQPEKERFEVELPNGEKKSNLGLAPPPLFSHVQVPHPYGFRQNPASVLQQPLDDKQRERFVYKQRSKNLAITGWAAKSKAAVPSQPTEDVLKEKDRCDKDLLQRLDDLFEERPVWRREALLNQFAPNDRRSLQSNKAFLSLVAYCITEGPWKDCLVRFGHDVRDGDENRFFQRVMVQGKGQHNHARANPIHRGVFKAYGAALSVNTAAAAAASSAGSRDSRSPARSRSPGANESPERAARAGSGGEEDEDGAGAGAADGDDDEDNEAGDGNAGSSQSHIFDGITLARGVGNYMLCDVTDPIIRPYIEADGPENVRESVDASDGWYTSLAMERIKALIGHRFRSLLEHEEPASEESCRALINSINERAANAAHKAAGGSGSAPPRGEHDSQSDDSDDEAEPPAQRGRGRGRPRGSRGAGAGAGRGAAKTRGTGRPRGRPRGSGKGKRGGAAGPSTGEA